MNRTTLVLAAAVALLAIILVFQQIDFGPAAPELSPWDGEGDRIVIETADSEITLERSSSGWVVGSGQFPANEERVNAILDQLSGIGSLEIVSQRENYGQYELGEDSALRVAVFQEDTTVRELLIGKTSSVGRKAYARTPDRGAVFLVDSGLRRSLDTSVADLREKTVVSLTEEEVERIVLARHDGSGESADARSPGRQIVVQRAAESESGSQSDGGGESESAVEWQVTGNDEEVAGQAIDAMFRTLSRVDATSFELSAPEEPPVASISVERADGSEITLSIHRQSDQGNYAATASTVDYPFLLPSTTVERLFMGLEDYPGTQQ